MKRILRRVAGTFLVLLGGYWLLLAVAYPPFKENLLLRIFLGGLGFACAVPGLYVLGALKKGE